MAYELSDRRHYGLSAVFDHVWVLGITRAILIGAALFLAASIFARVWQGAWLKSVGQTTTEPVSDSVDVFKSQVATLREQVLESNKVIEDLAGRVPPES